MSTPHTAAVESRRAHRLLMWRFGEHSARHGQATKPVTSAVFTFAILTGLPLLLVGIERSGGDQWSPLAWVGAGVVFAPIAYLLAAGTAMRVFNLVLPVRAATVEGIERNVFGAAERARELRGVHRDPVTGIAFAVADNGGELWIAALAPARWAGRGSPSTPWATTASAWARAAQARSRRRR